ncbi:hypothetical protein [Kineobactrum salinum]|uniref:Uncharacterized protein n=1 Tax=Kineobactrum salinum TaxID=2708301 RepID=A0A6C0TYK4_9GAMM|nr:hypothetical protein [Kineobactrum salinum]QIB64623.1 hypothetical protein G3T16_03630 [Kineobactrum salinum]
MDEADVGNRDRGLIDGAVLAIDERGAMGIAIVVRGAAMARARSMICSAGVIFTAALPQKV